MRWFSQSLSSIRTDVPRPVQTLQLGGLLNAFGTGLVFPFLIIYLHNVRGISLGLAGLIVGTNSAVALVAGPAWGPLVDRFGPREVLRLALVFLALGFASFAFVHSAWQGFVAAAIAGPRKRRLLAGAVDLAGGADRAVAAAVGVRGAADHDEPWDRHGRRRRRSDRDHHTSGELSDRCSPPTRSPSRCSGSCSRGCRGSPLPIASTAVRAASPMCSGTARSWR